MAAFVSLSTTSQDANILRLDGSPAVMGSRFNVRSSLVPGARCMGLCTPLPQARTTLQEQQALRSTQSKARADADALETMHLNQNFERLQEEYSAFKSSRRRTTMSPTPVCALHAHLEANRRHTVQLNFSRHPDAVRKSVSRSRLQPAHPSKKIPKYPPKVYTVAARVNSKPAKRVLPSNVVIQTTFVTVPYGGHHTDLRGSSWRAGGKMRSDRLSSTVAAHKNAADVAKLLRCAVKRKAFTLGLLEPHAKKTRREIGGPHRYDDLAGRGLDQVQVNGRLVTVRTLRTYSTEKLREVLWSLKVRSDHTDGKSALLALVVKSATRK